MRCYNLALKCPLLAFEHFGLLWVALFREVLNVLRGRKGLARRGESLMGRHFSERVGPGCDLTLLCFSILQDVNKPCHRFLQSDPAQLLGRPHGDILYPLKSGGQTNVPSQISFLSGVLSQQEKKKKQLTEP